MSRIARDLDVSDKELRQAILMGMLAAPLVIAGFLAFCLVLVGLSVMMGTGAVR